MSPSTTTTYVLAVPELLELVLSHLSFHDILRAAKACRAWRDTAKRSLTLQRGLFLKPIPTTAVEYLVRKANEPLCSAIIRSLPALGSSDETLANVATLHPIFLDTSPGEVRQSRSRYVMHFRLSYGDFQMLQRLPAESRWREMHITQPPSYEVRFDRADVCCLQKGCFDRKRGPVVLWDHNGVKLGAVIDAVKGAWVGETCLGQERERSLSESLEGTQDKEDQVAAFRWLKFSVNGCVVDTARSGHE